MRRIAFGLTLAVLALLGLGREQAMAQTAPCITVAPVCVLTGTTTYDGTTAGYLAFAWYSPAAGVKSQTLEQCTSSVAGKTIIIKDAIGTAGTVTSSVLNSIGIVPYPADMIDGVTSSVSGAPVLTLNTNHQSVTLQCDGAPLMSTPGNWMIE